MSQISELLAYFEVLFGRCNKIIDEKVLCDKNEILRELMECENIYFV